MQTRAPGQTLVASAIAHSLRRMGVNAIGMKPFAEGIISKTGVWQSEELQRLAAVNAFGFPARLLCTCMLDSSVSPADLHDAMARLSSLVLRYSKLLTNHTMSSSKVFHWKRTGCAFISSMPWMMRCFNSSSEATRI